MTDDLIKRIKVRARAWAGQISKKANSTPDKPKHIRVRSSVSDKQGGVTVVSTGVSSKGDARAYEYGSGIHARRSIRSKWQQGAKGKILITPKRKKVLAFHWEAVNTSTPSGKKFIGISGDTGKAMFRYVEHPGVKAAGGGKGYLAPAVNEVNKKIRQELSVEVRREINLTIKRAFKQ